MYEASEQVELSVVPARIGRQGIFDRQSQLVGYELLFRGDSDDVAGLPTDLTDPHTFETYERATSSVIVNTFADFGLAELSGGHPLFINMTRRFVTGELNIPFAPGGMVLELMETETYDDDFMRGAKKLFAKGYSLAIDDFAGEPERLALVPYCSFVKIDIQKEAERCAELVEQCREARAGIILVAERVETAEHFEWALELGFDRFQGFLFHRPTVMEGRQLAPAQATCFQLLRELSSDMPDSRRIESLVRSDPSLSIRILRTANSVGSGVAHRVKSLHHALVLLGPRTLSSWVVMTLVSGITVVRQDHVAGVLARAVAAEMLAPRQNVDETVAYTVGLITAIADVIGCDAAEVGASIGMEPSLFDQVSRETGKYGELIADLRTHELDLDRDNISRVSRATVSQAYLYAWGSAHRILQHATAA